MRVDELASRLGATHEGDGGCLLTGAAMLDTAGPADLAFAGAPKLFDQAAASRAGCVLVPFDYPAPAGRTVIRVRNVRAAFARAVAWIRPAVKPAPGIHPSAVVDATASVPYSASVGPHAIIAANAVVGENVEIGGGCFVGERVRLGENSILKPRVTIYPDATIGARALIHSGAVIGADGFGFEMDAGRWQKFPQIGGVEIGDDVEIGANTCIDRAALGVTRIGNGVKLDNQVHIGHNCTLGNHVVIAAQTGMSGGVTVGDYAIIGGQVGIGDKARIESKAVLGSGCGILTSKIVRGGQVVWGTPARPLKEYLEQLANLARLPELRKEVAELKKHLKGS
jgi:UDP-3-O-[3-hydroxymyristoyl] glucosamine N-acyltransferase